MIQHRSTVVATAGCATFFLANSLATANIVTAYSSPTQYSYKVTKVPDFDQRRAGLPNNGSMYCVPTSAFNWMAYIANHGYPSLSPGSGNWQQPSFYTAATLGIFLMGFNMGTSGTGGTGLNGAVTGMQSWINSSPYPGWFIAIGVNDTFVTQTTFDTLANQALMGRLVLPRIGWYNTSNHPTITRTGGHVTSMTRALRSGSSRTIGINDPASDDGNLSTQGTFTRENYGIQNQVVIMDGVPRNASKMVGYGSGYIDGYRAIMPIFGLATSPSGTTINITALAALGNFMPPSGSINVGSTIHDMQLSADALSVVALTKTGSITAISTITRFDIATGQSDFSHTQGGDIKRLALGRKGQLFFATATTLARIDFSNPDLPPQVITTAGPVSAIAYDDLLDEILVLDVAGKKIYRYPEALFVGGAPASPKTITLPANAAFVGEPQIAVNPVTGRPWYATASNDKIFEVIAPAAGGPGTIQSVLLTNVGLIHSLQFDDLGRIYICDGSVKGFLPPPGGAGGTATPMAPGSSPLIGLVSPKFFRVPLSRNNFDAAMNVPAQWDIVLPTQFSPSIPDCIADITGDDVVDGVDLGRLLAQFGNVGFSDADLNSDGIVDGSDLGILLSFWGPCPQ